MQTKEKVYKLVSFVPKGKVLTYQKIAEIIGFANPRVVGNILHDNPNPRQIPCHRVVNIQGRLATGYAFGGIESQKTKLNTEGIKVHNNKIDLSQNLWSPSLILRIYFKLLDDYGEPGPWPWFDQGDPHSAEEIAIGAILTQNTNWKNVQKSLDNLKGANIKNLQDIHSLYLRDPQTLKLHIRPSCYYNQKAEYLFTFTDYVLKNKSLRHLNKKSLHLIRSELLNLRGIGEETADTIILYSLNQPIFIIDAYTKRFLNYHNFSLSNRYEEIQKFFMSELPEDLKLFQDFHALIVRWAQNQKLATKSGI